MKLTGTMLIVGALGAFVLYLLWKRSQTHGATVVDQPKNPVGALSGLSTSPGYSATAGIRAGMRPNLRIT